MIFKRKKKPVQNPPTPIDDKKINEMFEETIAEVDRFLELSQIKKDLDVNLENKNISKKKPKV